MSNEKLSNAEICRALGQDRCAVVSRRQLAAATVPRWFSRNELKQRRWQTAGKQTLVMHNGPLDDQTRRWIAVLETGGRAVLDGITALQESGLKGLTDTWIHVSTPKSSTPVKPWGVTVRETRCYRASDVMWAGIPRMKPAVAAVHAALWARSDRQAKLFIVMTVQQGLASVEQLAEVLSRVRRHKRRLMLRQLLVEVGAGAQSLGELDVSGGLRRRGLPEPTRQSIRKRKDGTEYLDCEFEEYDVVLEVDGAAHDEAANKLADLLRDVRLMTERRAVVRVSNVAWALDQEAILDGLEELFHSRGWRRKAA